MLLTDILKTVRGVRGTSLVFQWLGLPASSAGGTGLVPGWGTINKIPPTQDMAKKYKISFKISLLEL